MAITNHERIGKALDLVEALAGYIARRQPGLRGFTGPISAA